MQVTITLRFNPTPVRVASFEMTNGSECCEGWGERDIYTLLLGTKTRVATKEIKVGIPQKLKRNLSYDPTTPLLSICSKDSIYYRDTPSIHNS